MSSLQETPHMQDEEKNEVSTGGEEPQAPSTDAAPVTEPPHNPNMKWYIIHSYSGFERKVKESLESRVIGVRIAGQDRQSADPD